ncbi:dynamin family protein [Haloglycomyces albus]|uniref:dynamin family protein n=1 Tax=Haloglycomyces albus TaxID=526067 RepID=UPI00046CBF64|nr:dynamin family protein [Haloglycomyces albus]
MTDSDNDSSNTEKLANLRALCTKAASAAQASLRSVDSAAAAEVDQVARWQPDRPVTVVVGETKRGKSSLVNSLLGTPGLSPVDVRVATNSYLEFAYAEASSVRAWLPGNSEPLLLSTGDLRNWATALGDYPTGYDLPRRMLVGHPAPLLKYVSLVDTPGTGGLEPDHAQIALEAVSRATCLLMVTDASCPLTKTELDFLAEASSRVNFVVFVLTKTDSYPGWRDILAENRALIDAHAPRFRTAPHFPVSALLAEKALASNGTVRQTLAKESGIGTLQRSLAKMANAGEALLAANVARAARSEFARLAANASEEVKAYNPDPDKAKELKAEKKRVLETKQAETRKANLALQVETNRAKVEMTTTAREHLTALQEQITGELEKADKTTIEAMPQRMDIALQAVSSRLSEQLHHRFMLLADRVLRQVFTDAEMQQATSQIQTQLRAAEAGRATKDSNPDGALMVASVGGMAFMAGRTAAGGLSAGLGAVGLGVAGGAAGIALSATGVGLGLAAGAFLLAKRKIAGNRQAAKTWAREVITDARASLNEEISLRFNEVQYIFSSTLDEALRRRGNEYDSRIDAAESAVAADKAARKKKQESLKQRRDSMTKKVKQLDEVLAKTRGLLPKESTDG